MISKTKEMAMLTRLLLIYKFPLIAATRFLFLLAAVQFIFALLCHTVNPEMSDIMIAYLAFTLIAYSISNMIVKLLYEDVVESFVGINFNVRQLLSWIGIIVLGVISSVISHYILKYIL